MQNQLLDEYSKLNIACGDRKEKIFPKPWLNIDLKSPYADIEMDVRVLPVKWKHSFSEVRASHVLEHFFLEEWPAIINSWVETLKPGGILRIAVPDIRIVADMLAKKNNRDLKNRLVLSAENTTAALTQLYGIGYDKEDTDPRWRHRVILDDKSLISFLKKTGHFQVVVREEKLLDSAALHNINDDSQNSWSMTIIAKKKGQDKTPNVLRKNNFQIYKSPVPNDFVSSAFNFIFNNVGQLLVVKNERGWDIPGGHLLPNERSKVGVIRETREEAQCNITKVKFLCCASKKNDNGLNYSMHFFTSYLKEFIPFKKSAEISQREFMTPSELLNHYGGGDLPLLKQVLKILGSNPSKFLR